MKKIMIIPLDERPCNYQFAKAMCPKSEYEVVLPDLEILGRKKTPASTNQILEFIFDNICDCSCLILSVDMLVYGGILPSRLHYEEIDTLLEKLDFIKQLKHKNPDLIIYAYSLIMRNPSYSDADEEPDYYEECGREIHRFGILTHLNELRSLNEDEASELAHIETHLNKEHLEDYLSRRDKNIVVNKRAVELTTEGTIDFLIIPQDDSSLYGLTAKDQQVLRQHILDKKAFFNVYMYPDADGVANTLLARYICKNKGFTPKFFIKYSSEAGNTIIPLFEDRNICETIKYHILAIGGRIVACENDCDVILAVNVPAGNMRDWLGESTASPTLPNVEYDALRTLVEFVESIDYFAIVANKPVIIADVAYANGGDVLLIEMLKKKELLFKIASYAGWNTSSNSLATCIPSGVINTLYTEDNSELFLAKRYVEDVFYCAIARQQVTEMLSEKGSGDNYLTDENNNFASHQISLTLQNLCDKYLRDSQGKGFVIKNCHLPWKRMFELSFDLESNTNV